MNYVIAFPAWHLSGCGNFVETDLTTTTVELGSLQRLKLSRVYM